MKPTTQWQWWFNPYGRSYARFDAQGWHTFDAGIIKMHNMPKEGEALGKDQYRGFIIRFSYWFPIDRAY